VAIFTRVRKFVGIRFDDVSLERINSSNSSVHADSLLSVSPEFNITLYFSNPNNTTKDNNAISHFQLNTARHVAPTQKPDFTEAIHLIKCFTFFLFLLMLLKIRTRKFMHLHLAKLYLMLHDIKIHFKVPCRDLFSNFGARDLNKKRPHIKLLIILFKNVYFILYN
jgi:hypothetical protein